MTLHRSVIAAIDVLRHEPFAIHEVVRASGASRSSVIRVLNRLVDIQVVSHSETAFRGRHYRVTSSWGTPLQVAKEYEMALLLKL